MFKTTITRKGITMLSKYLLIGIASLSNTSKIALEAPTRRFIRRVGRFFNTLISNV